MSAPLPRAVEVLPYDESGNVHRGDVISHDSQGNLVFAENALGGHRGPARPCVADQD